ncbi:family 16 glycosylhydrolase [Ulvibacterium marinum]|uniref:Glycosyl hydrolase family protein n=1 Tax=Ulvibacterium marinum TaxID=2419782 RepID=A0A3B0C898_9FLAO|nr:family 16 glycosylhydrolase [Ulvibacterium marinum]RKN81830.1 glycosyl hydrolase family protein [Ulvibacterium marinum]
MKVLFYTSLLFFCFHLSAQTPKPSEGYQWVVNEKFSDEFNGSKIDAKKWYDRSPYWVNGRPPATLRAYSVSVKDGNLQIKNSVLEGDSIYNIAGGAVASVARDAHYGYYESRIKASSISMSSTFWLKNKRIKNGCVTEQQELDIVEIVGQQKRAGDFRTTMKSNAHFIDTPCDGKEKYISAPGPGAKIKPPANEAYHVYGRWWVDATTLHFYLDGKFVYTINPSTAIREDPFYRPMYMHLVTETYNWETPPTPEELADDSRNTTYYDWVRAYTLEPVD